MNAPEKRNDYPRIGYDAKRITNNATGLGNYARGLVQGLAHQYPTMPLHLYSYNYGNQELYSTLLSYPQLQWHWGKGRGKCPLRAVYYRNVKVPRLLASSGVQLFHGLSNELPYCIASAGIPSVLTMHDLIYERYPETYGWLDVQMYRYKYRRSCQLASHIVAVSEQTKKDLVDFYNVPSNKISVVYQSCNPIFQASPSDQEKEDIRRKYGLNFRYMLNIGTVEKRKNAKLIVQALSALPDKNIHLVIVGRATPYAQDVQAEAQALGVAPRVHWLKGVPTLHLPALYAAAEVFVYPSVFEGFGIPVLEALTVGVPVVAAKGSCLEEAGGEYSLYCNPLEARSLACSLEAVLQNPHLRIQMKEKGKLYAQRFNPNLLAQEMMQVYQRLLSKPHCQMH